MPQNHVLLVDDDAEMRALVGDYLAGHAMEVSAVPDGAGMARVLSERRADIILLDLNLGQENGLDLLRKLAGQSEAPIIIITGRHSEEADKVVGLELGADDYMIKPFGLRELVARMRVLLRRREGLELRTGRRAERRAYRFQGWELNTRMRQLTAPDGTVAKLTAGELNLLSAFLRSPQRVLSREQLITACHVHDEEVYDRSIDVQILRLRRKLEDDPAQPTLIRTERCVGYIFTASVEAV